MKLMINEIYHSIQGESSYSGRPCIFIRLTYCNLRCSYCDSEHTFYEGKELTIEEILEKIKEYPCNLVEVTGGEPLFQKNCIILLQKLVENKYEVLGELNFFGRFCQKKNSVSGVLPNSCFLKTNKSLCLGVYHLRLPLTFPPFPPLNDDEFPPLLGAGAPPSLF